MNDEVFTYVDPRNFDGTPYEAAAQTVDQLTELSNRMLRALDDANVVIRSAEMERQVYFGGAPDAAAYEKGGQRALLRSMESNIEPLLNRLRVLRAAATYDPKHPPKVNG